MRACSTAEEALHECVWIYAKEPFMSAKDFCFFCKRALFFRQRAQRCVQRTSFMRIQPEACASHANASGCTQKSRSFPQKNHIFLQKSPLSFLTRALSLCKRKKCYLSAKEPYIFSKEPRFLDCMYNICESHVMCPQKSRTFSQKSRIFLMWLVRYCERHV